MSQQKTTYSRPTILLIEDNPADIALIEEALSEESIECSLYVLGDGSKAIAFLDQADADDQHPVPDLVLLDLNLPRISGYEVLQRVRLSPRCGAATVLIVSSSDAASDRERAMRLGATDYFRKPSSLAQFMELGPKVRSFLEGKLV